MMIKTSLLIHVESSDIFYQSYNTSGNFYNLLLAQQDDQTAPITKKFSYHHSFEKYVSNFLQSFSLNDIENFDLFTHKNSKCLFYRFNDYIKMYSRKRKIMKHTLKVKDSIGLRKIEERNRQFLVEKILHSVEFENPYENSIEKKPEIIETVESNYRIIRRIYQHLYAEIADIFFEYIHHLDPDEIQQLNDDIKSNGWGVTDLLEIDNSLELLSTFQLFYDNTGRLPLTNGLMILPDGEVPEREKKVNFKSLYKLF